MKILLKLLLFLSMCQFLYAQKLVEFDYELDLYYSNISAFIDLEQNRDITDGTEMSESKLYKHMFLKSFSPNIFLVELSVHPMGIGGLYFRDQHEELYEESKVEDFNWVKALTAGYEEPYSISFFLGRMMIFDSKHNGNIGKNRAYMGYMFTFGDRTIKDNQSHDDVWMNFEIKLKGTREKKEEDLDWSFRVGSRIHENKDFVDNIYIGARRSSIDYNKSIWSFIYNSAFSSLVAISAKTFHFTEGSLMLEKKFPSSIDGLSFGLGLGYLYTSGDKYNGVLKDEGIDNHQFIFRPNFKYKF